MDKMSAFGKAFASARKAGQKTFEFNGKQYTTKRADDVPDDIVAANQTDDPIGALNKSRGWTKTAPPTMKPTDRVGTEKGRATSIPFDPAKRVGTEKGRATSAAPNYGKDSMRAVRPGARIAYDDPVEDAPTFKKGGSVRGAGCAIKGKGKGTMR